VECQQYNALSGITIQEALMTIAVLEAGVATGVVREFNAVRQGVQTNVVACVRQAMLHVQMQRR